jgi:YidC/Oxa1 family membrane protein insertase
LDSTRSLIIFVLLIVAALFYNDFITWIRPPKTPPSETQVAKPASQPTASSAIRRAKRSAVLPTPTTAAPVAAGSPAAITPQEQAAKTAAQPALLANTAAGMSPPRTIKVDTNYYKAIFTTRGARLKSFRLRKYRETVAKDSPLYDLVLPGKRLPLGMVIRANGQVFSDKSLYYSTSAPARVDVSPGSKTTLTFTAETGHGLKIVKTFTFRDNSYVFDTSAAVSGATAGVKAIGLTMSQPLGELSGGYRDYPALQADVKGSVYLEYKKELKKGMKPAEGEISYAGIGDRYFLSALIPKEPAKGQLRMGYGEGEARAEVLFAGVHKIVSSVYMGPKELGILESVSPNLSKAIDFGWFGFLAIIFVRALHFFHTIAPNYGWDIVLLTVAVRVATLPASVKAQRSALRMQRLAPQVEKIREKFKDDSTRLNHEMMDLYKRNHVNPLGGCLPTAIQFPILYGLYEALLNAVELRHAPFIGWIRDLSAPDCYPVSWMPKVPFLDCHGIPILVLLMGVSTYVQQSMMPKPADPNQQKMMMWMPIFFTVLFIALPAGLSLYYFASNILGIIQQFFLNREFKQYAPVATA